MADKKTCFVVQGFGKKTDFKTGRVLDLDESYEMIKDAVVGAGLECVRADEIMHSGSIDVEMWEAVLNADLVVADVSTSNWNAAYELGVRHALRPRTTIVIAEKQFEFAFDINHVALHTYSHLGEEIGSKEKPRFTEHLQALIEKVMADTDEGDTKPDSPIYISINDLGPPAAGAVDSATQAETDEPAEAAVSTDSHEKAADDSASESPTTWKAFVDKAMEAKSEGSWSKTAMYLEDAHDTVPKDDYITQQLALATYKSKEPDEQAALEKARDILEKMDPHPKQSNDTETLGIWGAIHKRLWMLTEDRTHLDEAIRSYGRGFWLRNDYYNGINFAFLLNIRASVSEPARAIADFVQAEDVRREVVAIAEAAFSEIENSDEDYWIPATLWEACVGLGDEKMAAKWEKKAREAATESWMLDSTEPQIAELEGLLADAAPTKWITEGGSSAADASLRNGAKAGHASKHDDKHDKHGKHGKKSKAKDTAGAEADSKHAKKKKKKSKK